MTDTDTDTDADTRAQPPRNASNTYTFKFLRDFICIYILEQRNCANHKSTLIGFPTLPKLDIFIPAVN